ncbi:MAG: acyl-CoA dehydrogenase family protein [candidate division Zixibacteria bacterium]|nr:acyl-CoA dehydrogenase family protein [candidate division Zixibacteria bacterium]
MVLTQAVETRTDSALFELSEEARDMREATREFAEKRIFPNAEEWDAKSEIPEEIIRELQELGYFSMLTPEEYGGLGLSMLAYAVVIEELSAGSAGLGITVSVNNSLVIEAINLFSGDEVKKKYLPKISEGWIGAYCLSEPGAGTDILSISTTAVREGDHYVLNGSKLWVTNAGFSDLFIVFAKTDKEAGRKGMSAFVVERKSEGLTLGKPENKLGIRCSDTREVNFVDVKVPGENLMGAEGDGFKTAVGILNGGRIGVGAQAVGIGMAALDASIKYSKERRQFNQPIANFQAIQFKLAQMATRLEAARLMVYRAAALKDQGVAHHREASMAKLFASQAANYIANEGVQIHGGYGYIKEYAVERYFRDARITEIYEGTSEAQQMVISRDLLKDRRAESSRADN